MCSLFRALTDRVKAVFVTHAALEFEAEFLARDAERKAELLRLADTYEKEGLHAVAESLQDQEPQRHQRQGDMVVPTAGSRGRDARR